MKDKDRKNETEKNPSSKKSFFSMTPMELRKMVMEIHIRTALLYAQVITARLLRGDITQEEEHDMLEEKVQEVVAFIGSLEPTKESEVV